MNKSNAPEIWYNSPELGFPSPRTFWNGLTEASTPGAFYNCTIDAVSVFIVKRGFYYVLYARDNLRCQRLLFPNTYNYFRRLRNDSFVEYICMRTKSFPEAKKEFFKIVRYLLNLLDEKENFPYVM